MKLKLIFPILAVASLSLCDVPDLSAEDLPGDAGKQTFNVVSYNIKRGLGNDNKTDLDRTAAVLRKLKADFIALQEVDRNTKRSGNVDQAVELGKALGMNPVFGKFMDFQGGEYGMAVLSRFPVKRSESVTLPTGNEPRVAIAAEVTLPDGQSLMLINVHFDWVSDDKFRFAQATALKGYLNKLEFPYILMGDFNDVPESRTLKLLSKGTVEAKKPANDRLTWSSTKPQMEIDFIFGAPAARWTIGEVKVIDEKVVSDHRPVTAVMQLKR